MPAGFHLSHCFNHSARSHEKENLLGHCDTCEMNKYFAIELSYVVICILNYIFCQFGGEGDSLNVVPALLELPM